MNKNTYPSSVTHNVYGISLRKNRRLLRRIRIARNKMCKITIYEKCDGNTGFSNRGSSREYGTVPLSLEKP